MRVEKVGSWKILAGRKFTAFVRAHRTTIETQKILETIIRKTGYKTPIFLRELRDGGFIYDYISDGKVRRAVFDTSLNKTADAELQVHPEVDNFLDEAEFFAQASISEDVYRNYYMIKYFHRPLPSRPINPFAAKISGDEIEGLIMHHSYTDPFIEYITVSDTPEQESPDPLELHTIDGANRRGGRR